MKASQRRPAGRAKMHLRHHLHLNLINHTDEVLCSSTWGQFPLGLLQPHSVHYEGLEEFLWSQKALPSLCSAPSQYWPLYCCFLLRFHSRGAEMAMEISMMGTATLQSSVPSPPVTTSTSSTESDRIKLTAVWVCTRVFFPLLLTSHWMQRRQPWSSPTNSL